MYLILHENRFIVNRMWKNAEGEGYGDIEKAIDCAKELEEKYRSDGKTIFTSITEMNPYTSVYKLIEQFMLELSQ